MNGDRDEPSTLVDVEPRASSPPREALLVHIGSPADGFEEAGRCHSLAEVHRVRFVRTTDSRLEVRRQHGSDDGGPPSRRDELQIAIPLRWVSGLHARLEHDREGVLELFDCGSRNGTFVEGQRIQRGTSVSDGDLIEIGRSFWMVRKGRAFDEEVGASCAIDTVNPSLRGILRALERVAASNLPILLMGETGVGKDALAQAIHRRAGGTGELVQVNVMADSAEKLLLDDLGEGSLLASARGGTLFLDEVGELSLDGQTKLLSALMGHAPTMSHAHSDAAPIRIIAASTRDLRQMVATQAFRADLYARLAGYEARLPPLRDRREDLGLLVHRFARRRSGEPVAVDIEVFRDMLGHDWPFNVRELKHALQSAVALTDDGKTIDMSIWDQVVWRADDVPSPARIAAVRHALVQQLAVHAGDTAAVATSLKCDVADVERWLTRFSIEADRFAPLATRS